MSVRVYVDIPNIIGDNIAKLYAVVEMKDGTRVVSGGDIMVWAKETTHYKEIKSYNAPTNGSIFLKTYPNSHLANIAYDDGKCYVYVDLGGSRTRFTSDWWNASYKTDKEGK